MRGIAASVVVLLLAIVSASAQEHEAFPQRAVPAGKTPRTSDGKPDLSGV